MRNRKKRKSGIENHIKIQKNVIAAKREVYIERYVILLLAGLAVILGIGFAFKLQNIFISIAEIVFLICIPFVAKDELEEESYRRMFQETEQYIEHMLMAFKQNGKILSSLQDTRNLFEPESLMYISINQAIEYIKKGKTENNLYKEALEIIEKEYDTTRVKEMHQFFIEVENKGGSYDRTIDLLLEDKQIWQDNIVYLQKQKRLKFKQIIGLAIGCSLLCAGMVNMGNMASQKLLLSSYLSEQILGCIYICSQILIVKYAKSKTTTNWLKDTTKKKADKRVKNYNYLIHFKYAKEKRNSALFAAPFFIMILPLWLWKHNYIFVIIPGVIGVCMLFQHRLNYSLSYKEAKEDLLKEFPKWL